VRASDGLTAVVNAIRDGFKPALRKNQRIPRLLAVAITKSDETLLSPGQEEQWIAGWSRGQDFWHDGGRRQRELEDVSARVEDALRKHGFNDLVSLAKNNFARVHFFAVSSLGHPPIDGALQQEPRPVGVETPLYWILTSLR
jgi:hypothetical protein